MTSAWSQAFAGGRDRVSQGAYSKCRSDRVHCGLGLALGNPEGRPREDLVNKIPMGLPSKAFDQEIYENAHFYR